MDDRRFGMVEERASPWVEERRFSAALAPEIPQALAPALSS
jgi:hypothetical protein